MHINKNPAVERSVVIDSFSTNNPNALAQRFFLAVCGPKTIIIIDSMLGFDQIPENYLHDMVDGRYGIWSPTDDDIKGAKHILKHLEKISASPAPVI